MDHTDFIASSFMEHFIGLKRIKHYCIIITFFDSVYTA